MMTKYNLSIVMPVYNSEKYLKQSIESYQKQSLSEWELVVVDDQSTDGSYQIAQDLAINDKRIKVLRLEKNSGVSTARHHGNLAATGEIIVVADSDDYAYTDRLNITKSFFITQPEMKVFYGNIDVKTIESESLTKRFFQPFNSDLLTQIDFIPNPASAYLKEAYFAVGGYDPDLKIGEDYDLWLKMLSAGYQFGCDPKPIVQYNRHSESITNSVGKLSDWQQNIKKIRRNNQVFEIDPKIVKKFAEKEVANYFLGQDYYFKLWFSKDSIPEK
jgi:glycosyltransferase involved in cell wall biosynthesis